MIWTIELATYLDDAPWPATKEELIDYAMRTGAPSQVIQNLEELEDSDEPYESIEEIWSDYPRTKTISLRTRKSIRTTTFVFYHQGTTDCLY